MDGQFVLPPLDEQVQQRNSPHARGPLVIHVDLARTTGIPPDRCTPTDPFGRGGTGAKLEPPSPYSKSEEQMNADRDRSAQDFGLAIYGPLIEAGKWFPPSKEVEAAQDLYELGKTLQDEGTDGLLAETAKKIASKMIGEYVAEGLNLPEGSEKIVEKAASQAISQGGGSHKDSWEPREHGQWTRRQDETQRAVDAGEAREREDPGSELA